MRHSALAPHIAVLVDSLTDLSVSVANKIVGCREIGDFFDVADNGIGIYGANVRLGQTRDKF